jgi:hypothetical protein
MDTRAILAPIDETILTPLVEQVLGHTSLRLLDWHVEAYGGGASRSVYRVAGHAAARGTTQPWSLILKVAAVDGRVDPTGASYWKREILAYQSGLLADLPAGVRTPRCFGTHEHPGGGGWLWLEEITDVARDRWSLARFTSVARQLGAFSAAYLTSRSVPTYPWLSRGWFRGNVSRAAAAVALLPALVDHPFLAPALPGRSAHRVLQLISERGQLLDGLDALPQTFCHIDAFPRNILVRTQGGTDGLIVLIDWDSAGVSALGADLAALVGGSLFFDETDLDTADVLEQAIIGSYLSGLRAAGWQGDQELVRFGYNAALVLHYLFLLVAVVVRATKDQAFRQVVEQLMQRPYQAVLQRNAGLFEFLLARGNEAQQLLRSTRRMS